MIGCELVGKIGYEKKIGRLCQPNFLKILVADKINRALRCRLGE